MARKNCACTASTSTSNQNLLRLNDNQWKRKAIPSNSQTGKQENSEPKSSKPEFPHKTRTSSSDDPAEDKKGATFECKSHDLGIPTNKNRTGYTLHDPHPPTTRQHQSFGQSNSQLKQNRKAPKGSKKDGSLRCPSTKHRARKR
uniref:Uncharacterized protein n=1 Tax=Arundo donax TaxID=35708 RepID=A0A0A9FYX3_ARUDO